jgi:hypothetical protein
MNKTRVVAAVLFILLLAFGFGGACSYFSSQPAKKTEGDEIQEIKNQISELNEQLRQSRQDQIVEHRKTMAAMENLREHAIKASQSCAMAEVLSRNSEMEKFKNNSKRIIQLDHR